MEQRQRLRRQGQGTAPRAGRRCGPILRLAWPRCRPRSRLRRQVAGKAASGAGSLTRAAAGTRAVSSRSSVTGARTCCCRGSTRRSCWPGEDTFFPPMLGTGGNDGRLDFSTNFHQQLLDVHRRIGEAAGPVARRARDLLDGTESRAAGRRRRRPVRSRPARAARGRRGSARRTRWSTRGATSCSWRARCCSRRAPRAATSTPPDGPRCRSPSTGSPDGSASGAAGEESRGEVWAPVWTPEFTLAEIKQLFAEARASWRGRPARRAVDFYAATRTLGVARGIDEFTRYGLQRRNGLAFAAVPLDRVEVREHPEVRLAAEVEDWASRFSGSDASAAVGQAARGFEAAHLWYARDGGALPLARHARRADRAGAGGRPQRPGQGRVAGALRAARRGNSWTSSGKLRRPELRVAVGLASCATLPGPGQAGVPSRSMRQILLPVDPPVPGDRSQPNGRWRDAPLVPGFGSRPLPLVLADVLIWRSRTALAERDQEKFRGVPTFRSGIPVPAADLHAFAPGRAGREDPGPVPASVPGTELARRGSRMAGEQAGHSGHHAGPASPAGPRPAARRACERRHRPRREEPELALSPDWAARLAAGQVSAVHDEAAARLRQAGWDAVPAPPKGTGGQRSRIAAALVPRCLRPRAVLTQIADSTPNPLAHEELS